MLKKILLALLVVLIGLQLIRVKQDNPVSKPESDFITVTNPPQEIGNILKGACYDCHSYQTVYPWYFNVAPLSWWLKGHVNKARKHLNFSLWGEYPAKQVSHKLKGCIKLIDKKAMPLDSYTWMHEKARLSDEQRQSLSDWFKTLQ